MQVALATTLLPLLTLPHHHQVVQHLPHLVDRIFVTTVRQQRPWDVRGLNVGVADHHSRPREGGDLHAYTQTYRQTDIQTYIHVIPVAMKLKKLRQPFTDIMEMASTSAGNSL